MYRETIRKALEAKRAEAQKKWTEFDEARKAIQAEGFDPTKDKDAFEKAHELQKAYALIAEGEGGVRDLTAQYEKALDIDGAPKPDNTPFTPEGEAGTKAWQSPGDRVLASENPLLGRVGCLLRSGFVPGDARVASRGALDDAAATGVAADHREAPMRMALGND